MRSYLQGVVIYKMKLSGVAPRKRETTNINVGSARYGCLEPSLPFLMMGRKQWWG